MRTLKILTFVLGSIFLSSNAQNLNVDSRGRIIDYNMNQTSNNQIEGSIYINENFAPVIITQYNDKIYSGRFNALNGEIEIKLEENKVIALDTNSDFEVKFTASNKIYRTESFVDSKGIEKKGFLVLVNENKEYALFKEEIVKFHEKIESTSSYDKGRPARYIREKDNYYIKNNNTIHYISQNKKDLLQTFPNESDKLKSFIKKNKINLKQEDDLVKIVNYLDALKE